MVAPTDSAPRFIEAAGEIRFSYVPPKDWFRAAIDNSDLAAWAPPADACATCLLVFTIEKTEKTVEESVQEALDSLPGIEGFSMGKNEPFFADSGVKARRFDGTIAQGGFIVRTVFYVFGEPGWIVAAGYDRLMSEGMQLDAAVEQSLKSFSFEK